MEEYEFVGSAAIGLHCCVLLLKTEQIMSSIEAKLILEYGRRMRSISEAILDFFLDDELILVNIGDDGCWIEMGKIDDEMYFCVDVDDPLLLPILAHLQVNSDVVVLGKFEVEWQCFVDRWNVDVVCAFISKANIEVLFSVLEIYLMEFFELFWFEDGLVDSDRKGEVVEDKHSWDYPEIEERDVGFCVVMCFFLGMRLSFADVVEFINHLLVLGLLFEISQLGCLLCYLIDGFLVNNKLDLTLVRVIRNGKEEQSSGLFFLIFRT